MPKFDVYWSIEIEAESEEDSIRRAVDYMRNASYEELTEDIQTTEINYGCETCGGPCKQ
jgi:hypothetical protein